MKQIIITCDDCGMSEGINIATADLHEQGIATAASIMTNLPAAQHAFDLFAHYPALEIGLHLNLTDGTPLSRVPRSSTLVDAGGEFRSRAYLLASALLPGSSYLDHIRTELRAQIEGFLEHGRRPQHLTTHMHFHVLPTLRNIVMALAAEYSIPWVRSYRPQMSVIPYTAPIQQVFPVPNNDNAPVTIPDYLAGIYFWVGHAPRSLCTRLTALPGTSELVVHPGLRHDPSFPRLASYAPDKRAQEARYVKRLHPLLANACCA